MRISIDRLRERERERERESERELNYQMEIYFMPVLP